MMKPINNMMNTLVRDTYDVIFVGSGIANIMCAIELLKSHKDMKILMIDKGNPLYHRGCPKNNSNNNNGNNECVKCKNCSITTGWGGSGTFSDCKLSYSPEIGGIIGDIIGEEQFDRRIDIVDKIFTEFGGDQTVYYNEEYANALAYQCQKYSMRLIKSKYRHLGTDGSYKVMSNIYDMISHCPNVSFLYNTSVKDVDFENKIVTTSDNKSYHAKYISIGVGRYGASWLKQMCSTYDIKTKDNVVDIGVRVEVPSVITDNVTNNLYEFKIINYSSAEKKVRTFCINGHGVVSEENYDGISCVNGHAYLNHTTDNTNFALLVTCEFTEPFNDSVAYGKRICELTNMLTGGKPLVQRLVDLKNYKRTTADRLKRISIIPSLKNAVGGDLRLCLPSDVLDGIIETMDNLNNIFPGINGKDCLLYAPECKFYSNRIIVNENMECDKYKDVFFIGDGSGNTRGIMQASISGITVAEYVNSQPPKGSGLLLNGSPD